VNAIVSLLDEEHDQTVRNRWAELEDYDLDGLRQILEGLILDHRPFTVGTSSTAHSGRGARPPSASDSPTSCGP
jgi:hypothetical protein